jgi:predicted Zn finger-like uncharacterized protein
MSYSVICPSCDTSFPIDPDKVPEEGILAQCSMCPEVFGVMRPEEPEVAQPIEPTAAVATEEPPAEVETSDALVEPEDFVIETAEGILELDTPAVTVPSTLEESTDPFGSREIAFDEPIISPEPVLEDVPVVELEVEPASEPEPDLAAESEPEPDLAAESEPELDLAPEPEPDLASEPVTDAGPAVEEAPAEADTPQVAPIQFGRRDPSDKARSLARSLVSDIVAYHKDKHTKSLEAGTLVEDFDEEVQKSWKEYTDQVDPDVVAGSTFFNDALNEILAGGEGVFTLEG